MSHCQKNEHLFAFKIRTHGTPQITNVIHNQRDDGAHTDTDEDEHEHEERGDDEKKITE